MITRAIQKNIKISSKKAILVCRLIRNKKAKDALSILFNQEQKAAKYLLKLLKSAISNAINNHAMAAEKLYIFKTSADQAGFIKRSSYRAKGRTDVICKRKSHLSIYLSDDINEKEKLNKILLKPRAHQHKYKDITISKFTKLNPKKIYKK